MHVTIERASLYRELSLVHTVVERRHTIPILSHVCMEAREGKIVLTGTDLDVSLRLECEADVREVGTVCIPARKFFDIVRALGEEPVVIGGTEQRITLTSGRSRFRLAGLPVENFPDIPALPQGDRLRLPAEELQTAIRRVIFATTMEEARYALSGVQMEWVGDQWIRLVATDGHRLALCEWGELPGQGTGSPRDPGITWGSPKHSILVPKKAMRELSRLIEHGDSEMVEFSHDENHVFFRVGSRQLVSRLLTGQFPNYELVIPKEASRRAVITASVWREALDRVAILSDERSRAVRIAFSSGGMVLTARPSGEDEEAVEEVLIAYEGEPLDIAFRSDYIADFLGVVEGDVEVWITDAQSPVRLAPRGDTESSAMSYVYVVMPMRLV